MGTEHHPFKDFIWDNYLSYKHSEITKRRFKYDKVEEFVKNLKINNIFDINIVGKSFLGRNIYKVKWGSGPIHVLLWSQMHGNESTATRAFLDIINFFKASDQLDGFRQSILDSITIHFIPVLNPDGMDRWQRRTVQQVDMNRDALASHTPESSILKKVRKELNADFGFNLHDQKIYYSVGESKVPAAIAFLSPPYNKEREINGSRKKSIQLIAELNDLLQERASGRVARYDDEFNVRAFGDNIQKWGTSTILVESGGYEGDPEKEHIRKLNFYLLLNAFNSIANCNYENQEIERYFAIPENWDSIFDLLVRNISVKYQNETFKTDIGIRRNEENYENYTKFYFESTIDDVGDLSFQSGYQELKGEELTCEEGKVYEEVLEGEELLDEHKVQAILKQGYTYVRLKNLPKRAFTLVPINLIGVHTDVATSIDFEGNADFIIRQGENVRFSLINGFLLDHENFQIPSGFNARVISN